MIHNKWFVVERSSWILWNLFVMDIMDIMISMVVLNGDGIWFTARISDVRIEYPW